MGKVEGSYREALALLPSSHPLISRHGIAKKTDASKSKPKGGAKSIPTWRFKACKHAARRDGLELQKWVKGFKDVNGRIRDADDGESFFAKFNQKVQMFRYTSDEYDRLVAAESGDWSRAETDYLMDMCERFDLRFPVVADRYEFPGSSPRTVEDLKDRYYSIARKLLVSREGGESAVANHTLIRYPYNKTQEADRKRGIQLLLTRTPQQLEADNLIMADCKAIEDRRKAAAAAIAAAAPPPAPAAAVPDPRLASQAPGSAPGQVGNGVASGQAGAQRAGNPGSAQGQVEEGYKHASHFPNQLPPGVPSLFDVQLNAAKPPQPGVYFRSGCTAATFQAMSAALTSPSGLRVLKATEQTLLDLGYGPLAKPTVNTRAVSGAWLALRSEIITLHETRKVPAPRAVVPEGKKGKRR